MTVNFKPYVFDQVRHTWCMLASPEDETFIVNLSNANAADVLAALGLSAADENNPMPIDTFSNLTTAALRLSTTAHPNESSSSTPYPER